MAPVFLQNRAPDLTELMDNPDCDLRQLHRTYQQFYVLNRLLAGWHRIYTGYLRGALAGQGGRLLDIGCGGGDVMAHIARWAVHDGLDITLLGIDPDERAIRFARERTDYQESDRMSFRAAHHEELLGAGERFDAVISNHLLHHLQAPDFDRMLSDSAALSRGVVIHNDIRRSDWAPLLFQFTRLLFRDSFVVEDGLRSIRRAYTHGELANAVGPGWKVKRLFPFRNLLIRDVSGHA